MHVLRSSGFTLLEMAIVIVVISLLLGSFLTPIATEIDHQRIQWTERQLEEIKGALWGFSATYKRLPCPTDTSQGGTEKIFEFDPATKKPKSCQINGEGFLPWKTLGVGRYDAWGKPFRYRIAQQYANDASILFSKASNLEIKDVRAAINLTNTSEDSHVAAIIFSDGKNAAPDDENSDLDTTYVMDTKLKYLGKGTPHGVDDILTWLSTHPLAYHLVATRDWPK